MGEVKKKKQEVAKEERGVKINERTFKNCK